MVLVTTHIERLIVYACALIEIKVFGKSFSWLLLCSIKAKVALLTFLLLSPKKRSFLLACLECFPCAWCTWIHLPRETGSRAARGSLSSVWAASRHSAITGHDSAEVLHAPGWCVYVSVWDIPLRLAPDQSNL